MQTTLRIDDQLYREAKAEAAREGVTLTRFLHEALLLRLRKGKDVPKERHFTLPTYRAGREFPFNPDELKRVAAQEEETHDLHKIQSGPPNP